MAFLFGHLLGQAVIQKVGLDIGMKVIGGVASSAKQISSLLGFIKSENDQSDLTHFLRKTDIEVTIKILECIVSELRVGNETPVSVINSLKSLHESLVCIENELQDIKRRLQYNRSLYVFKSLRSYGFKSKMKNLTDNLDILDNRKKLLFETIEISASLERGHINNSILNGSWISPSGKMLNCIDNDTLSKSKLLMIKDENSDSLDRFTTVARKHPKSKPKKSRTHRNVTEKKNIGYGGLVQSDISVLDDSFIDSD